MQGLRTAFPFLAVLLAAASGCATGADDADEATGASADELRGRGRGRDRGEEDGHGGGAGGGFGGIGGGGHRDRPGAGRGRPRPPRPDWHGHGRGPVRIEQPQGAYFANISANGTGCPDGSWDVAISEDGETFTLRFNAYEATVAPGQLTDVKDCRIDLQLGSPEGTSFSVASFAYQGFVFLEKDGMKAKQTANYFFSRERENATITNELNGPKEETYTFTDDVQGRRRAWSPCGKDEALRVNTRLIMNNDRDMSGEGYINSAVLDGALFKWKLNWRRCRP